MLHNFESIQKFLYSWIMLLVLMVIIDFVWLSIMGPKFYKAHLHHLFAENIGYFSAFMVYFLFTFGLSWLVIIPALNQNISPLNVAFSGFIFGLVVYGVYDLTNQATLKNWPVLVTVIDALWGGILSSAISYIGYKCLCKILHATTI
jgi:uncharacterized membrane protein